MHVNKHSHQVSCCCHIIEFHKLVYIINSVVGLVLVWVINHRGAPVSVVISVSMKS